MTKTLSSLYDSYENGRAAAQELEASGITAGKISLLANNLEGRNNPAAHEGNESEAGAEAGMGFGAVIGAGIGAAAGIGLLAVPGLGPIVATGWLAAAVLGAVGGGAVAATAGGLVGALVGNGLLEEEANILAEGVRRGGTLVTVLVTAEQEEGANRILRGHHMVDVAALGQGYRSTGWTRFDGVAPPVVDSAGNVAQAAPPVVTR